jgi:Domain of unknown function (DUF397)
MIVWRKSNYSGTDEGTECVEVAGLHGHLDHRIGVRDSKNPDGPVLIVDNDDFRILLDQVKADAINS